MPPKRGQGHRPRRGRPAKSSAEDTTTTTTNNHPPPSSDDAKPNVDQLNAALEAEQSLPSDPLTHATEPKKTAESSTVEIAPEVPDTPAAEPAPDAPLEAPSAEATAATGSPAPATTSVRGVKTRPRYGRRSQGKREELQKADEEKRRAEAEARAAKERKLAKRGRGGRERGRGDDGRGRGRTRGRGGYMGDSQRVPAEAVASGPFSGGQVHKDSRHVRRPPPSSGWNGLQPGAAEREGRTSSRKAWSHPSGAGSSGTGSSRMTADGRMVKTEDGKPSLDADGDIHIVDGGYIESDEEDAEKEFPRLDVERLGIVDLTQDDDYDPFAPIRVMRVAHKERTIAINAEGATNQEGTVTVDANDVAPSSPEQRRGKQKAVQDDEVTFAAEPKDFQAVYSESDGDVPSIKPDPESGEGAPAGAEPGVSPEVPPPDPPSSPETKEKTKEKIKASAISTDKPQFLTHEEREEWERRQTELKLVRGELGLPAPTAQQDETGDAAMVDASREDRRADKVYLFQFPPVLPHLQPISVKPDPEAANGDAPDGADAMQVDPSTNSEDKDKPITIPSDTDTAPKFPSGAVGKLKVHASGRVTLDWGGTSLCLGMGTESSFLQDVVLTTLPDRKEGEEPEEDGLAASVGQVKGKFVVTPDWEEILK